MGSSLAPRRSDDSYLEMPWATERVTSLSPKSMTAELSVSSTTFHGVPFSVSPSPTVNVSPFQMKVPVRLPSDVWIL
jgi:hypothetical protein